MKGNLGNLDGWIPDNKTSESAALNHKVFHAIVKKVNRYTLECESSDGHMLDHVVVPFIGNGYHIPPEDTIVKVAVIPQTGGKVAEYRLIEECINNPEEGGSAALSKARNPVKSGDEVDELHVLLTANHENAVIRRELDGEYENQKGDHRNNRLPKIPPGSTVLFDSPGGGHQFIDDAGNIVFASSDVTQTKYIKEKDTKIETYRRRIKEWPGGKEVHTDEKQDQDQRHQDLDYDIYTTTNNHKKIRRSFQFGHNTDSNDPNVIGYIRHYNTKGGGSSSSTPAPGQGKEEEEQMIYERKEKKDGSYEAKRLNKDGKEILAEKYDIPSKKYELSVKGSKEVIKISVNIDNGLINIETQNKLTIVTKDNITVQSKKDATIQAKTIYLKGKVKISR